MALPRPLAILPTAYSSAPISPAGVLAYCVNGLTFLASIVALVGIRTPFQARRSREAQRGIMRSIVEGLHYVYQEHAIRLLMILNGAHRFGFAPVMLIAVVGMHGLALGLVTLADSIWLSAVGLFVAGMMETMTGIVQVSYRIALIPDALQGRVNSVYRLLSLGAMSFGTVSGGILIDAYDPSPNTRLRERTHAATACYCQIHADLPVRWLTRHGGRAIQRPGESAMQLGDRRGDRDERQRIPLSRRAFLLRTAGVGGATIAVMLAQACRGDGPPPAYAPAGSGQQAAPPASGAPTQAPAAAPASKTAAPAPASQPAAAGQPKRGGTLISAVTAEPPTLDPHLGFPSTWSSLIYDYLVYFDAENKVQPNLAESWDIQNDGATVVFKLRQGVKFHNGREVVADDVKYSMERLQQPTSVFARDYAAIQSVEIVDPRTVKLNFGKPFPGVFRMLGQFKGGEIVAKEAVEQHGDLARTGMGTGPFKFDHWTPGSEIVLKKNPEYWRQGLPYLDQITFKIIPDEAGIVAGLRTGAVHSMQILDFTNVRALESDPNVTVYKTPRVQDGVAAMYVNARIGPLADQKVREALYWSFDREAAVKIATAGLGVATGPISPTVTPWALPDDEVKKWWKRDLDAAKKAADEARASGKYPDGIKTAVWADATTRWRVDVAQILSSNAQEVGITCEVTMMEAGTISKGFLAREAPIYPNTWGASAIDPDASHRFLHSKGQDYPYVNDPEMDKLLDDGRYTWDPTSRKGMYDKIQRMLLDRFHGIWMYHVDFYDAARKNVHYTRNKYPPMILRGLEETWIE